MWPEINIPKDDSPLSANRVYELAVDLDKSVGRNEIQHLWNHFLKLSFSNASVIFTYKMNNIYLCNTVSLNRMEGV